MSWCGQWRGRYNGTWFGRIGAATTALPTIDLGGGAGATSSTATHYGPTSPTPYHHRWPRVLTRPAEELEEEHRERQRRKDVEITVALALDYPYYYY